MPLDYRLDPSASLVRARACGTITERQMIETIDGILRETAGQALHWNVLTVLDDGTSLDHFNVEMLERVQAHLRTWQAAYPGSGGKSAFVTRDSANASVLRLWQAVVELNPAIGRQVRVFNTEADALAWLSAGLRI